MAAPTRAKKNLGRFLAGQRDQAGNSLVDAATELKVSDSIVSRYETGEVLPAWATVKTLLKFYGAGDAGQLEAARLWEIARDEPPPVRLPVGTPKSFRTLVNAEQEAAVERVIAQSVVPGLLQTEQYTRALFAAAHRFNNPDTSVERLIAHRLTRQKRLGEPNPLVLHALIDETAITRVVGDPAVMRDQLGHLLTLGARPTVTIQVIAFGTGAYGTMSGGCFIISYPDPEDPQGVYLEYPAGGSWVENADDVRRFTTMFDDVAALALSPDDTADLIHRKMRAPETR